VSALELQHAVADERWKQVVERLDSAAHDRVETRASLDKIADQLTAFKLADAKADGAKTSVSSILNWGLTIATTIGTLALGASEFFKGHSH
jgi:hypothetical protein